MNNYISGIDLKEFAAQLVAHLNDGWTNEEVGYWVRFHHGAIKVMAAIVRGDVTSVESELER